MFGEEWEPAEQPSCAMAATRLVRKWLCDGVSGTEQFRCE